LNVERLDIAEPTLTKMSRDNAGAPCKAETRLVDPQISQKCGTNRKKANLSSKIYFFSASAFATPVFQRDLRVAIGDTIYGITEGLG
jgi:hypothetical protein